jgi:superfamily II DNA or RNA helicase
MELSASGEITYAPGVAGWSQRAERDRAAAALLIGADPSTSLRGTDVRVAQVPRVDLPDGTFVLPGDGGDIAYLVVSTGTTPMEPVTERFERIEDSHVLARAAAWFAALWAGAEPVGQQPAFHRGELVGVAGSDELGEVVSGDWDGDGYTYKIRLGGGVRRFTEAGLRRIDVDQDDPAAWVREQPGTARHVSLLLTHTKLSHPLSDTVYSYGASKTVYRPYQFKPVLRLISSPRKRLLIADEVGLGKTIEAGMVLKEYLMRGMVESVLVLAPASLVGQWREELETKFDIPCATTHDALLRSDPDRFWNQKRLVASLALARRSEHAARLIARSFDLVVVDEAHHLHDRASQSYKLVDALNKRFLLLLSATPVQNDLTELYNVLTLLKPGIFKTLKEFRAAYVTPGKPRQPANPERLRALMRDAMVRNTRAVVALKLPRRHAVTIRVDGSEGERVAYQELAAAARRLAAEGSGGSRLALQHLLGAAGSSPGAAAAAIRRFAGRHSDAPSWYALVQRWASVANSGKEAALVELLRRNPEEKKLVFVHYRETLAHLADLLAREGLAFARFEGGLSGPDKDAAVAAFRESVPVLLCTESGGEGRNMQFCNTLINFDVPWNPMAIEQRIGRIDRIGQQREVFVFNLVTRGTLEEQVLQLLDEKISMFELVVGEVGAILGGLEEDRDFADLMLDAWLRTTEASRNEAFDALGHRLHEARQHHESAKALDESLFGEDFEAA